jgi:formylglycine-generating enzyme required for sulfatase activity
MERLPPAYVEQEGKLLSSSPLTSGYRLPTEAEWEYCARFTPDRGAVLIYPWGNAFPPADKAVNIADVSARDMLPGFFDTYEDGYPVSAPPGSFAAGALGISDLAGNVAEWCHDYYSIYSYAPGQRYQDPAGATEGKHHLIRGSSWKHASISALRSAFRDYSSDKRSDVGFRVCRYGD